MNRRDEAMVSMIHHFQAKKKRIRKTKMSRKNKKLLESPEEKSLLKSIK